MSMRRGVRVGICWVVGALAVIAVVAFLAWRRSGLTWPQPPVDLSSVKVEVPASGPFTSDALHGGVRHIEHDVSFMRGCSIKAISYVGPGSPDGEGANDPNRATFLMSYACDTFNAQTMSMSPRGSYVYVLEHAPDRSSDGSGWVTRSFGNG
ncbi:MAG: hypothetical protein SOI64_06800 [Bifidobacterium mongoliense]|jgi:hypothetical protein|uniref:hypothetical protein n=1 Tax=Bifidobacterium mongoliense TaxID=518643 RepID=UPI002F3577E2